MAAGYKFRGTHGRGARFPSVKSEAEITDPIVCVPAVEIGEEDIRLAASVRCAALTGGIHQPLPMPKVLAVRLSLSTVARCSRLASLGHLAFDQCRQVTQRTVRCFPPVTLTWSFAGDLAQHSPQCGGFDLESQGDVSNSENPIGFSFGGDFFLSNSSDGGKP
jgi:hypothetical protein